MKLPSIQRGAVETLRAEPDQSREVRAAYQQFAKGADDISKTIVALESQRLDDQQEAEAHDYDIRKLNFEAEHFTKESYEYQDSILEGLDVKRTEPGIGPNGEVIEVNRHDIPADEVWPALMKRQQAKEIEITAARIESPRRREAFLQKAKEEQARDFLNTVIKTSEMQEKRADERREWQITQLRTIGTPDSWDKIEGIISRVTDTDKKAELADWASRTREFDTNASIMSGAEQDRDEARLQKGVDEYLGYARNPETYSGKLNTQELEAEAHKYQAHLRRVQGLNKTDDNYAAYESTRLAREIKAQAKDGQASDMAEVSTVLRELETMQAISPSQTNHDNIVYVKQAIQSNNIAREAITASFASGNFSETLQEHKTELYNNSTTMSTSDRSTLNDSLTILKTFEKDLAQDPMGTLLTHGFDSNPDYPIEPIDFVNPENLGEQLAQRQASYRYYQSGFGFGGDVFTPQERTTLNNVLADESMTDEQRLGYLYNVSVGTDATFENKIWGPSLADEKAGRYAAIGQLMVDYQQTNEPRAMQVGSDILRGYRMMEEDPRAFEDFLETKARMRVDMLESYSQFPGVVGSYMDNAAAYAYANNKAGFIKDSQVRDALETVTGGFIEQGGNNILKPESGLTQDGWNEWINEYSPDNFGGNIVGVSNAEVAEGLREGDITLVPTGEDRTEFYLVIPSGSLKDKRTGAAYIFKYNPNAHERYVPR